MIILLLKDGKTHSKIAEFLGCSVNKVSYWCLKGDPDNLESLIDERMKVNHKKNTDKKYIEILLETLEGEPQELGSDFVRWTGQRLAIYLEEFTGIKLSAGQVRRTLKQKKYVYRWTNYSLESKRNPEKITAFKIKIADEYFKIKKETPEGLQTWFWDESGFSLRVTRRKKWCKKGSRKNVRGDRRKGRVNVMRGLKYSDKKRFVEFLNKGNSNNFYKVLKIYYRELINEWVEAGNQGSQFAEKRAKIVIVLDNASFHKKEEYLKNFETEMPNLNLEILPE
jgi:transposase